MKNTVAIQGIQGSFHHIVADNYFANSLEVLPCETFDALVSQLLEGKTDIAVMAIENSIAGSIIPNYALIDTNDLQIVGEYYLDIQHHLMALEGQSISDIKEVHSHPMALLQCKEFFKMHPHIKLVEARDTADVARKISEENITGIGAIASEKASGLFGLPIVAESIQTIKHNETRFVIIQKINPEKSEDESKNKASLKFELSSKRGSLATVLNVMSDCRLNLTKIQSLPIIATPWKYSFFVDVTFEAYSDFEKAKSLLNLMAENFKVLGVYKNARL
ncbi:prephenate dehydratase [Winogradskyella maritima]|uniref:prephenate dehydratase n=1 Tax=Winogradskyella maritima TaxID=1517766 RepID=A0ABV8AJQ0_9FLAO|nr:prephenate dehydratase [Winogradskyella maritima]